MAGWHLRESLGLNESRCDLLDAAAGGSLDHAIALAQVARVNANGRGTHRPFPDARDRPSRAQIDALYKAFLSEELLELIIFRNVGHVLFSEGDGCLDSTGQEPMGIGRSADYEGDATRHAHSP